ncbi:Retrotransposon-derived protein PEG10 [Smittium mucronatum]|uniref:Retrotransposon-derived protein PEG10 n=1 Tax=Smittium mucronatum TaxID=133383 RepID=A0A1R0H217_9FUNG|nr:Retrotransposon-derived protein PEG10 [Smittium mucronatum]
MNPTPRDFFPRNIEYVNLMEQMIPEPSQEQIQQQNYLNQASGSNELFPSNPTETQDADPSFKLPDAPRFDGTVSQYTTFRSSMELFFWTKPETFKIQRNRIVFIGTHLIGPPAIWFSSLISASAASEHPFACLENYDASISEFERNFSDPSHAAYAAEFRSLARDSVFDNVAPIDQFMIGLNENIMSYLMFTDIPETLEANIDLAVRIDNSIATRNMISQNQYSFNITNTFRRNNQSNFEAHPVTLPTQSETHTPMEICAVRSQHRGSLSAEEKSRRFELGLCLYCGAA